MSGGLGYRVSSQGLSSFMGNGGSISPFLAPSPLSLLLLFVIMSVSESVPTAEFLVSSSNSGAGEKEMAISGRSLYWSSDSQLEKRNRDVEPIQLCGYRLLEAVRGLCRGNYVGYTRRSDPEMRDERITMMMMRDEAVEDAPDTTVYKVVTEENDDELSQEKDSIPLEKSKSLKSPYNSHRINKPHLRFRRNIIDECCKKPCSVNEMLRYCGRN